MAWLSQLRDLLSTTISQQLLAVTTATIIAYIVARAIYNLYFHPLCKYPGPRLAAATNFWWAYARTTGRHPWIVENALNKYGDVVRIAPNELVFFTSQAAKDVYLAQERNLELFVQVGYEALDTGDNGISGEPHPVKHREVAKKLAPAFSTKNLKAKEACIQKHIDLFIDRMREFGSGNQDLTYSHEMSQMRDMTDSIFLRACLKLNLFVTLGQVTNRMRLLTPLQYLAIPPSVCFLMPKVIRMNTEDVKVRIECRGKTEHLDYFEQLIPSNKPIPEDKKLIFHLENISGQLLLASWQPLADQFYSLLFYLLKEPDVHSALVKELRTALQNYEAINLDTVGSLKYLHACIQEGLRLHQETGDGLPRVPVLS